MGRELKKKKTTVCESGIPENKEIKETIVMCHITKFWLARGCTYDGGPVKL